MKSFADVMREFDPAQEMTLPSNWSQGRTVYGGLSAALALQTAIRSAPATLPPLRAAQVAFVGPASGALRFESRLLRQGKSAVTIGADCLTGSEIAIRSVFVFADQRESRIAHDFSRRPPVREPRDFTSFKTNGTAPNFLSNFDVRFAGGSAPISGSDNPELIAWVRHMDDDAVSPVVSLVAIADSLPPAAISSFTEMAPISSMTWSFELFHIPVKTGWFLLRSFSQQASNGYSLQEMEIWDDTGRRVLTGRQSVALYQ